MSTTLRSRTFKIDIYLGQIYSTRDNSIDMRRTNIRIYLKRQVYNSCALPEMTQDAETWALKKQASSRTKNWKRVKTSLTGTDKQTSGQKKRQMMSQT